MTLFYLLKHRLQALLRGAAATRRVVARVLVGLAVLYGVSTLGLLGVVAGDAIREVQPYADPARWMGQWLLPLGGLYAAVRAFVARPATLRARPYLTLPIRKRTLVGYVLGVALNSAWNWGPLAFWVPFWVVSVAGAHPMSGSLAYGAGLVAGLGVITHMVPWARQIAGERPLRTLVGLLGVAAAAGVGVWTGALPVLEASAWLFGGLLDARLGPGLVVAIGYIGSLALHRRQLRRLLDLDAGGAPRAGSGLIDLGVVDWIEQQGTTGRLVALELRFIVRNTQPRRLALWMLVFPIMVGGLAWLFGTSETGLKVDTLYFNYLALGIFPTGFFTIQHGQLMFSWQGRQLEGLLARNLPIADLLRAKLLLLAGSALALLALPLPALLVWPSSFGAMQAAFVCYNIGVGAPLMVLAAHFNTHPVAANESGMMQTASFSGFRMLGVLVFIVGAAVPFLWSSTLVAYLASVAALGLVSLAGWPLWLRLLRHTWHRRRHPMLEAFREAGA